MTPELVEALRPWGLAGIALAAAWLFVQWYRIWTKWRIAKLAKSRGERIDLI